MFTLTNKIILMGNLQMGAAFLGILGDHNLARRWQLQCYTTLTPLV